MTIIPFERFARYVRLRHEFESVTQRLKETRFQMDCAATPREQQRARAARRRVIRQRDQLEKSFDFRQQILPNGEVEEIPDPIGQRLRRKLMRRIPFEDLG